MMGSKNKIRLKGYRKSDIDFLIKINIVRTRVKKSLKRPIAGKGNHLKSSTTCKTIMQIEINKTIIKKIISKLAIINQAQAMMVTILQQWFHKCRAM